MAKKVLIAYFNAGNGHVACAKSVEQELRRLDPGLEVRLMDMGAELKVKELTDVVIRQWKNILAMPQFMKNFIFFIEPITRPLTSIALWQYASRARFKMLRYLNHWHPDLILSTHWACAMVATKVKEKFPHFKAPKNYYLFTELAKAYGPMNCSADKYFGMTQEACESLGHVLIPHNKISHVPMVLQPKMLEERNQVEDRLALDLEADKFTLLFSLGGEGIGPINRYLFALRLYCPWVQVLVVCGKNKALYKSVKLWFPDVKNKARIRPLALMPNLAAPFGAANLVAGKCGTSTAMECVALKKPIIVTMPGAPNEADNMNYLVQKKFAWYRHRAKPFAQLVQKLSDPQNAEGQAMLNERVKRLNAHEKSDGSTKLAQIIIEDLTT